MSDNKFGIPESLIKALKDGQVVPFIGAGVSMSVKKSPLKPLLDKDGNERKDKLGSIICKSIFPSWWEFLTIAADKLDKENKSPKADVIRSLLNDSPPDYLEAAQRAFDGLLQKQWYELLSENFETDIDLADEDSMNLAKLIWQLSSNLLITTNVDLILQSVHKKPHRVKILDTQEPEFAELQRDWQPSRPTVLHLHGHIDNEANVVFTKKQYEAFYDLDKNRAKLETLRNLFIQRTILFIGFSLDDLFILKELERVNLIYKGGANSFYALIRESEKDNSNIPSYVEKITFSEFGKPLEDLVKELTRIAKEGEDERKGNPNGDKTDTSEDFKSDVKKPFFNVPYNSKGKEFVGRTGKTKDIWNLLSQDGCASIGQAVSVKGFGGLGKTQLAVEYAHEYRGEYKNGVFWVVADENIDNQLLQIADKQGWINQFDKSVNQLDVAKAKFLELSECLIIFDNVEGYDDIKDYLPKTDLQTHILITSREKIYEFRPIDLELLQRNESRELLLKISNRNPQEEAEKEHLENILKILGDIPLAIELVGGYLAEHENVTFEKYHQFLNDVPLDKLEKEFPEGSFTNHDRSIIQTLRISEKTINEKPLMVEILKVLAWSGSSSMGTSLLQALVEIENEFEFETALGDAYKLRLLKKDEGVERYAIHRLLAKVIRHDSLLEGENKWHQKIVRNLEKWFEPKIGNYSNLSEFEVELEHLQEWQVQTAKYLPVESILITAFRANHYHERGNYQKVNKWLEQALNLYQTVNLNNPEVLSKLLNYLGVNNNELRNYQKAKDFHQNALEIRQALFGEKHPDTVASYNNMGSAYAKLGKYREALIFLEKALELRKELFGEKHPLTAASYNNVSGVYEKLGKHQEALIFQEKALDIQQELFGEKHPDIANSYNNIGTIYGELGKHQEALKYQEKALEIQLELLGKQHPRTIIFTKNLMITYLELGYKEKAGRKATEFWSYIPQNHPDRDYFDKISKLYRKNKHRHKNRRR